MIKNNLLENVSNSSVDKYSTSRIRFLLSEITRSRLIKSNKTKR